MLEMGKMNESNYTNQGNKILTEIKTFIVPCVLEADKENIVITTKSPSQTAKDEIIKQAFTFHSQGKISEAVREGLATVKGLFVSPTRDFCLFFIPDPKSQMSIPSVISQLWYCCMEVMPNKLKIKEEWT